VAATGLSIVMNARGGMVPIGAMANVFGKIRSVKTVLKAKIYTKCIGL
jgi:hypothetical protein